MSGSEVFALKENAKKFLPGSIILGILIIVGAVFITVLINTAMLTAKIITICIAVILLLSALVYLLVYNIQHKIRFIIGCVTAFVLIAVQIFASYYIGSGVAMLSQIATPGNEYSECAIYVRHDDPAQELIDVKDYTFGILATLDRSTTDHALELLSKSFEKDIDVKEYSGIAELLDALLNSKEVNAILLNKNFLEILESIEGLKVDLTQLRELYVIQAETEIVIKEPPIDFEKKVFTVYITGIDGEGGISRKSRSDVNILATINIETGQVLLVSTPRDYFVPLSISDGMPDKLTHAGIYGTQVCVDTMELLYDVDIDYYFKINFDGFKNIIDALGGVDVVSEYAFNISNAGVVVNKGVNHFNGTQALYFARDRKHVPGGERQRGIHQMVVIKAVIDKLTSTTLLQNYSSILESVEGSFETSMPYDLIAKLVSNQLIENTKWNIVSYAVNGTGDSQKPYSLGTNAYVMIPDETTVSYAKNLMEQVRNGEVPVIES